MQTLNLMQRNTQIHANSSAHGTIALLRVSISFRFCPPSVIGSFPPHSAPVPAPLPEAGGQGGLAEIATLPTRVTVEPGTTAGRIFAPCSVLADLQPGTVSDCLLSVFHTNPTLKTAVLRLINVDRRWIPLLVCVDSCPLLWRMSATRADIFIGVWPAGPRLAGALANWATWWAMAGADDRAWLCGIDEAAGLSTRWST